MNISVFDTVYYKDRPVTFLGKEGDYYEVGWQEGNEYHRVWVAPENLHTKHYALII